MRSRLRQNPIAIAALLAAYFIAAKLGLSFAFVNASVTAIWAPTGIALAGLLILGVQAWPVVFIGAFLANITTAGSAVTSLAIAAGNTLEALAGAFLVKRWAGGRDVFQSAQNIFRFSSLIATFATTISASVGVTVLCVARLASWSDYTSIWMIWWLGDLTGALVICPFVMLWSMGLWGWSWRQTAKAVALIALLVLVAMVVFGGLFPSDIKDYPLEFLVLPPLMWAAFSFGRREVATALVILSGIAIWGTYNGYGPFARATPNESFLLVQAYLCVTVVMSVALAALVNQYKQAEEQSRALAVCDPLTGLANYRRLTEVLRSEIVRSERTKRTFAVLFLDLDGLKKINDRQGHLAGNRALCRVAETLERTCRKMDTPARFGGDEFVVVLPETEEAGASRVAERISAGLVTEKDDVRPTLSISAGVALYPRDGTTAAMLLAAADRVLYQAKAASKDRPVRNQLPLPLLPV